MSTSSGRRLTSAAGVLAVAIALTGCSYVDVIGLRLNADGTLDFTSCEDLVTFEEIEVSYYIRTDDAESVDVVVSDVPASLEPGVILSLGRTPPPPTWDRLFVEARGTIISRGESIDWELEGVFDAVDLSPDGWTWQGNPPTASLLEACELRRERP